MPAIKAKPGAAKPKGPALPPAATWRDSASCHATYDALEREDLMDEFDDVNAPFDSAGSYPLSRLRSWNGFEVPDGTRDDIAGDLARGFLVTVHQRFVPGKQRIRPGVRPADAVAQAKAIFKNPAATLADLAGLVEATFLWPSAA